MAVLGRGRRAVYLGQKTMEAQWRCVCDSVKQPPRKHPVSCRKDRSVAFWTMLLHSRAAFDAPRDADV